MQTDILIYGRHGIIEAPRTMVYFQHLGVARGLSFAFINLSEEVIELTDGSRYDAGAVEEIEDDLMEPGEQVKRDVARGDWDHLPMDL